MIRAESVSVDERRLVSTVFFCVVASEQRIFRSFHYPGLSCKIRSVQDLTTSSVQHVAVRKVGCCHFALFYRCINVALRSGSYNGLLLLIRAINTVEFLPKLVIVWPQDLNEPNRLHVVNLSDAVSTLDHTHQQVINYKS